MLTSAADVEDHVESIKSKYHGAAKSIVRFALVFASALPCLTLLETQAVDRD
jgi:hypothetical protein